MEDMLKRLLEAESQAEALVQEADAERQAMIRKAQAEAHVAEEQLTGRIPAIRERFRQKAEEQAALRLKELEQHYEELRVQVESTMERHEREAVQAAVALLLDASTG